MAVLEKVGYGQGFNDCKLAAARLAESAMEAKDAEITQLRAIIAAKDAITAEAAKSANKIMAERNEAAFDKLLGGPPDLLPPMGIRNDRDMLNYLHQAFESEFGVCERCHHEEPTKHMDSAHFLREYLAAAPK